MLFERIFGHSRQPTSPVVHLSVGPRPLPLLMVRNPRARRYLLRLRPDGTARVTIPRGGSTAVARQFVERHAAWLERELQRLQAQPRKPAVWTIGTEILLRGEAVRIEAGQTAKLKPSASAANRSGSPIRRLICVPPSKAIFANWQRGNCRRACWSWPPGTD